MPDIYVNKYDNFINMRLINVNMQNNDMFTSTRAMFMLHFSSLKKMLHVHVMHVNLNKLHVNLVSCLLHVGFKKLHFNIVVIDIDI